MDLALNNLQRLICHKTKPNQTCKKSQEHRYHHCKVEIKYHDSGNGWIFSLASTWKNSVNVIIGGVGMLFSHCTLKSLNSIKEIQPRMMVATFNINPSTTTISCYSPKNSSDETDLITFYSELSSLVCSIPKLDILIIGRDMNAQIGKKRKQQIKLA